MRVALTGLAIILFFVLAAYFMVMAIPVLDSLAPSSQRTPSVGLCKPVISKFRVQTSQGATNLAPNERQLVVRSGIAIEPVISQNSPECPKDFKFEWRLDGKPYKQVEVISVDDNDLTQGDHTLRLIIHDKDSNEVLDDEAINLTR